MNLFLKKITTLFPSFCLFAIIMFPFFLKEKFKITKISNQRKIKLFNPNRMKNNLEKPFFILGSGLSLNNLNKEEKIFIENSTSVGINLNFLSGINPNYLAWEQSDNFDMLDLYLKIFNKKKVNSFPKLIINDGFLKETKNLNKLNKYFNDISLYTIARIPVLNKKKLKKIYDYIYHPLTLKLLGDGMIYGMHSTVDRMMHLAITCGFKEIVFVGIDLNNSKNFWEELKLNNYIKKKLKSISSENFNQIHKVEGNITEKKIKKIPLSKIIQTNHQYFLKRNIKFYTTSKKSKLFQFLPLFQFPKKNERN